MQVSNFGERSEDAVDNIQEIVSDAFTEVSKRKDREENALGEQPSQNKKPKKLKVWHYDGQHAFSCILNY